MSHGHKYKVTFLLLLLLLLLLHLAGGVVVVVGKASKTNNDNQNVYNGGGGGSASSLSNNKDSSSLISNSEDSLHREFIKVQILQRLGLNEKPHVDMAHKISKDLVLETLRRTENLNYYDDNNSDDLSSSDTSTTTSTTSSVNDDGIDDERHVAPHHINNNSSSVVVVVDEEETGVANYAKTSEIISFPDKGPVLNGHNLLSFSYAGSQAFGVGVRVKKAHLWVKLDYRSSIGRHFGHLFAPKGITLYVFQVQGNFSTSSSSSTASTEADHSSHQSYYEQVPVHLNIQDVDLELVVKRTISLDSLGWQKLDVTSVVQKWYGKQSRHRIRHANNNHQRHHHNHQRGDKLTLLVDCSGCGYCIQPIIFSRGGYDGDESSSSASAAAGNNDKKKKKSSSSSKGYDNGIIENDNEGLINQERKTNNNLRCHF